MSTFKIDFFELMFLAEVCIPKRPIARAMFWIDLCDKHYHTMSPDEREKAFEWLSPKLDLDEEDCRYFFARFNPKNQYKIITTYKGKSETIMCFLFNEKYYTQKNKYICSDYIDMITQIV